MMPKLVFVGDGPARVELEAICAKEGHDAVFMGHRSGHELATCYASADVFAFPSFTEVRDFLDSSYPYTDYP
jgi:glycosyltransferase involved in cell wall biosynthesis